MLTVLHFPKFHFKKVLNHSFSLEQPCQIEWEKAEVERTCHYVPTLPILEGFFLLTQCLRHAILSPKKVDKIFLKEEMTDP